MTSKRQLARDSETVDAPKKRPKNRHFNPSVDPHSGQRYAFTGYGRDTTVPDLDLDFEDDAEAIAYLNSVRQEASLIPEILVVKKHGPQMPPGARLGSQDGLETDEHDYDTYANEPEDDGSGGYFDDGAYIAAPLDDYDSHGDDDDDFGSGQDAAAAGSVDGELARIRSIRQAYHRSLVSRFNSLRRILHATPPQDAVAALPKTHPFRVGTFGSKSATFNIWSERLRNTDPLPVQVASMSKDGVLRVLRVLLGGIFLRRWHEVRERTTRWLWALLARLPERGALDHVEIGWVRELGRRAVLLATSVADMAELRDEVDRQGGDLGVHDAVDALSEDEDDGGANEQIMDQGLGEMEVDGAEESASNNNDETAQHARDEGEEEYFEKNGPAISRSSPDKDRGHDAESQSGGSMDLSDGEIDETEGPAVQDHDDPSTGNEDVLADITKAKARLLQQLGHSPSTAASSEADGVAEEAKTPLTDPLLAERSQSPTEANLHATITMILTVAGELYGQRDLLEFRHPFPGA